MNYAIIKNGIVDNIIWLLEVNKDDFPGAVYIGERPVQIGDSYADGRFYRNGEEVLTETEKELADMRQALEELGVYVNG